MLGIGFTTGVEEPSGTLLSVAELLGELGAAATVVVSLGLPGAEGDGALA